MSRYWLEVVINKIIDKYCLGLTHPDKTEATGASKRPNTKTNQSIKNWTHTLKTVKAGSPTKIKFTVHYTRQITALILSKYIGLYALSRPGSNLDTI